MISNTWSLSSAFQAGTGSSQTYNRYSPFNNRELAKLLNPESVELNI